MYSYGGVCPDPLIAALPDIAFICHSHLADARADCRSDRIRPLRRDATFNRSGCADWFRIAEMGLDTAKKLSRDSTHRHMRIMHRPMACCLAWPL